MRLTENRKPLGRRLLLPLGLSLALHALFLACMVVIPPPRQVPATTGGPPLAPLVLSVDWNERKPAPRPRHDRGIELPDDVNPSIELPRSTGHSVPVPAFPPTATQGGEVSRGVGGDGAGASGAKPPLLAAPGRARRIAYVVDRSVSMGNSGALDRAKQELVASLRALSPETGFRVLVYNRYVQPLLREGWLTPDEPTLDAIERRLADLPATGSTDHVRALRQALVARPDLLFWVTDADDLTESAVLEVTRLNNGLASIHVVELAAGRRDANSLLTRLAEGNRGEHRRVAPQPEAKR